MEDIEELYQTRTISGTIVLCETSDDAHDITRWFHANDHVVGCCASDVIRSDMLHPHLQSFADKEIRVLVMTYESWYEHKDVIEHYVCKHNLMIFYGLENQYQYVVMDWIKDIRRRGFLEVEDAYHVYALEKELNIS
jgi:hypothetical protein